MTDESVHDRCHCDGEKSMEHPGSVESLADPDSEESTVQSDVAESFTEHVEDLPDGAGCTEIWEHLGAVREIESDDD